MTIYANDSEKSKILIEKLDKFVDFDIIYEDESNEKLPIIEINGKYFDSTQIEKLFNIK